ncbi:hypothetical protein EV1_035014 [Malus domestica]
MASNPQNEPRASRQVEKPPIEPIRPPTVEEMRSQDIWSNCAIRSVVSGVMGIAIVPSFGLFLDFLTWVLILFSSFPVWLPRKRGKVTVFLFVCCLDLYICGFQNVQKIGVLVRL